MPKIGIVLWWSLREGNGIIIGEDKKEYYFDRSVLSNEISNNIKRMMKVSFLENYKIKDCLCAKEIKEQGE